MPFNLFQAERTWKVCDLVLHLIQQFPCHETAESFTSILLVLVFTVHVCLCHIDLKFQRNEYRRLSEATAEDIDDSSKTHRFLIKSTFRNMLQYHFCKMIQ